MSQKITRLLIDTFERLFKSQTRLHSAAQVDEISGLRHSKVSGRYAANNRGHFLTLKNVVKYTRKTGKPIKRTNLSRHMGPEQKTPSVKKPSEKIAPKTPKTPATSKPPTATVVYESAAEVTSADNILKQMNVLVDYLKFNNTGAPGASAYLGKLTDEYIRHLNRKNPATVEGMRTLASVLERTAGTYDCDQRMKDVAVYCAKASAAEPKPEGEMKGLLAYVTVLAVRRMSHVQEANLQEQFSELFGKIAKDPSVRLRFNQFAREKQLGYELCQVD